MLLIQESSKNNSGTHLHAEKVLKQNSIAKQVVNKGGVVQGGFKKVSLKNFIAKMSSLNIFRTIRFQLFKGQTPNQWFCQQ